MSALPETLGGWRVIYADPAWSFLTYSSRGLGRSAEQHYQCMTLEDLAALPVAEVAAPDSDLFMWVTGPMLAAGHHLPIMRGWGFEPSSMGFVWVKTTKAADMAQPVCDQSFAFGMGHTTRQNAEFVVMGRRGKPERKSRSVRQIIPARRREHSRKPDDTYARIEAYSDGPYLEMFARQMRPGWAAWGNETEKFGEAA